MRKAASMARGACSDTSEPSEELMTSDEVDQPQTHGHREHQDQHSAQARVAQVDAQR